MQLINYMIMIQELLYHHHPVLVYHITRTTPGKKPKAEGEMLKYWLLPQIHKIRSHYTWMSLNPLLFAGPKVCGVGEQSQETCHTSRQSGNITPHTSRWYQVHFRYKILIKHYMVKTLLKNETCTDKLLTIRSITCI